MFHKRKRHVLLGRISALSLMVGLVAGLAACGGGDDRRALDATENFVAAITLYQQASGALPEGEAAAIDSDDIQIFRAAVRRIEESYVEPIPPETLLLSAERAMRRSYPEAATASGKDLLFAGMQGMLADLDPYSIYLDEEAFKGLRDRTQGVFGGLGIEIAKDDLGLRVVTPIDDTPAVRAGLKAGDVITHADGQALAGFSTRDSVMLLRGAPGSSVVVTIHREGQADFDVAITREVIHIQPVKAALNGNYGYLRITDFVSDTGEILRKKIAMLEQEAGGNLQGLVVDLRNNPGGLLDESVDVAGSFLSGGLVVSTRGRQENMALEADRVDPSHGLPLVVLINQGSASASEIVAGAIKDRGRGLLIGAKSYGKGSVQTIFALQHGTGLKLTTALYYTPSGHSVDGGIQPDLLVEDDPQTPEDDQLDIAYQTLERLASAH